MADWQEIKQESFATGNTTSVPTDLPGEAAEEHSAAQQSCRFDADHPSAAAGFVQAPADAVADIFDATTDESVRYVLKTDTTGYPIAHTVANLTTAIDSYSPFPAAVEHAGATVADMSAGTDATLYAPGDCIRPSTPDVRAGGSDYSSASGATLVTGADFHCLHDEVFASSRSANFVLEDLNSAFASTDNDTVASANITALTESVNKLLSTKEQAPSTAPAPELVSELSAAAEITKELSTDANNIAVAASAAPDPNDNDDLNECIVYHGGARRRDPSNWRDRSNANRGKMYQPNRKKRNGFTTTKNIAVPSDQVGRIIGRGGSRIRELEYDSEVKIRVGDSEKNYTDLTLSGTSDAISSAEKTIKSILSDTHNKSNSFFTELYKTNPEDVCVIEWSNLKSYYEKLQEDLFGEYPPIVKDFYQEDPEVEYAKPSEIALWRLNNGVKVQRIFRDKPELRPIPNPALTFENVFKHYPEILNRIHNEGYQMPSQIQSQAWPILMRGDDLIGIAQPGSGETMAYLLPALIHIDGQNFVIDKRRRPIGLIMIPTRELALQVEKEVLKYQSKGLKSVCLICGGERQNQIKIVCDGVDLIIATPNRLNDLLLAGHLNMGTFSYIVLDGVDKMFEMGFEHQLRKALHNTRPDKQIVMISSIYSKFVRNLAQSYLRDPIKIHIRSSILAAVTQRIMILEEDEKERVALQFLRNVGPKDKVIVLCRNKETAMHLTPKLRLKGTDCASLVEPPQDLSNPVNVFIGTHGASYDMRTMSHVINFDFPPNIEEYVHKTSQLPADGGATALTFVTRQDWAQARALIRVLEESHQDIPEELEQMARRFEAMKLRHVSRARGHTNRDQRGRQ